MTSNLEKLAKYQKLMFWVCCVMFVALVLSYGYFLNNAVMNVVARKELNQKIAALDSRVGEFENRYMTLKNSVTVQLANSLGFESVTNPVFISRGSLSRTLSLNRTQ